MDFIPVANVWVEEEDAKAVYEVVRSGWLSKGKKVDEFESNFAREVNAKHAIAVNSGTSALHVVLAAMEIGLNDEVIVPSLTFISSANVVLYQKAKLVLVENDPLTFNTTAEIIEKAITPKTKAIMPVDMNGMPIDYDAILSVGKKYNIPVIADSAESLGARYKGKQVGEIAETHCFSFFPNKAITTGEGGMVTTNNSSLAEKMRIILNQGQSERYRHVTLGYNYRMNDIQAALGIMQLKRLNQFLCEKEKIVKRYNEIFKNYSNIIQCPHMPQYVTQHSWYMYAIQVDEHKRDSLVQYLTQNNVQTRLSFPPVHTQPFYQQQLGYSNESYPVAYRTWKRLINLPIWPGISNAQIEYVAQKVIEGLGIRFK
ncbi:MAG: DegT/DnrJ/EryC1/StrS family aminotransferase [Oligoflexia bacterium]|nr:DegT/DnrJ/EryC1/StrS family aminotransferase [Oligoflexia bacterium]